jgi:hypothetical protein
MKKLRDEHREILLTLIPWLNEISEIWVKIEKTIRKFNSRQRILNGETIEEIEKTYASNFSNNIKLEENTISEVKKNHEIQSIPLRSKQGMISQEIVNLRKYWE